MKFKVGDRVVVSNSNEFNKDYNGLKGVIDSVDGTINPYHLKFDKNPWDDRFGWVREVKLVSTKHLKNPTHLVVWEVEGCGDPCEFFTDEKAAKEKVKKLSDDSSVKKESIVLVEIKSAQKVNVIKNVRLSGYKI